ncbi:hypothetical protein HF325_002234 [Metschnikowia pulcherrima]|uniref:Uncharacterized protein n=1 Tax=Metschnikowia pulcherrima TaxID=27326 RepID=A0A8H7GUX1_9ASCO|nr:hypothetical protein HF325_002234 [Metschnikowia pulcherrima]
MRLFFNTDGPSEKGYTSKRKLKTTKKREPDMDANYSATSTTSSIPMSRTGTLIDSYSTQLGLNNHNLQPTSSLGTLHDESVELKNGAKDQPYVREISRLKQSAAGQETHGAETGFLSDTERVHTPFSQAFGDLFTIQADTRGPANIQLEPATGALPPITENIAPGQNFTEMFANFDTELLQLIGKPHVFDKSLNSPPNNGSLVMLYQEENRMLRHFFQELLPLLDAHPQSPWPALALRYCDFDVARSCFISLACIHIYESRQGGKEYYDKGMAHIHSTMTHLIDSISALSPQNGSSPDEFDSKSGNSQGSNMEHNKTRVQQFVILVLVNVHILFAVLEKGKSSLARYLFEVFGLICHDDAFYRSLIRNESKGSLVVVLSWYDTVSAMVSPDCRLPFCSPDWYGSYQDVVSTLKMMGCPGEIFRALSEVCFLRHEIKNGNLVDNSDFGVVFDAVRKLLLNYRDYVDYRDGSDYMLRLKGAQCWSLAVYISLLRLFRTKSRDLVIRCTVNEFIDVYRLMPSDSPVVTQMVWPIYAVGCECATQIERDQILKFMDTLYETAQMGTLASLRWIVQQVWLRGIPQEEVLDEWLEDGVDYLPL